MTTLSQLRQSIDQLIEDQRRCITMTQRFTLTEKQKEAQQLCKDLEVLCTQDSTILEEVIDEYVYLLDDNRLDELQHFVRKELEVTYA